MKRISLRHAEREHRSVVPSRRRRLVSLLVLLSFSLALVPPAASVLAQRTVTVTADQPNVWTLEQAHYLLAQMHRRNLDLKAKRLDELDANEITGLNIDILRSVMEFGATYSEVDQFTNKLTRQDKGFNSERRRKLIGEVDDLNREKLGLTRTIARLKREKEIAKSDDEKDRIEAQIQENIEVKAEVEAQIASKNEQINALGSGQGTLTPTNGSASFDPQKFPKGILDDALKSRLSDVLDSVSASPKLNASLQLDKFIQLQYEIISKQLTLLRDEVGPGERLLFLELPQSINANYDKSDDMWAQSRWRIDGFTRCEIKINGKPVACHKILYPDGVVRDRNRNPRTTLDTYESVTKGNLDEGQVPYFTISDIEDGRELAVRYVERDRDVRLTGLFAAYETGMRPFTFAEEDFRQTVKAVRGAKDALQKAEEDLRECLAAKDPCVEEQKKKLSETVGERREAYDKMRKSIPNPPAELLNRILVLLNAAVGDKTRQLSLDVQSPGFVPARTRLLRSIRANDDPTRALLNRLWIEDLFPGELHQLGEEDLPSEYYQMILTDGCTGGKKAADCNQKIPLVLEDRTVRTVEIIPRQGSLNVNDVRVRNRSSVLNFIVSTLFGLGANFNYQQQRERYSQFVQQELYSSGFGKGAREFGWTFTSMPGTDRLLSGTRNTYAVLVVPKEATAVALQSIGCSFDRTARQPESFESAAKNFVKECSNQKNFLIPIPGGGFGVNNDFYVSGLTYQPVGKGKRVVVSVYGTNFSSQIGVLVNGVPLLPSIGIAQSFIRDDSKTAEEVVRNKDAEKVRGSFERVDSDQIVASFELTDGDVGTPVITLVAPGKSVDLNGLSLYINGRQNTSLAEAEWMFGKRPANGFRADDVEVFVSKTDPSGVPIELTALVTGQALDQVNQAFVNGRDPITCIDGSFRAGCTQYGTRLWLTDRLYKMTFPPPLDERIQIILARGSDFATLPALRNPAKREKQKDPPTLKPTDLSFSIKNLTPFFTDEKKTKILYILVEIEGRGFGPGLEVSIGQLDVVSETKAFITVPEPKPAQTVRLTDSKRNIYAVGVVEISEIVTPTPSPVPTPKPSP